MLEIRAKIYLVGIKDILQQKTPLSRQRSVYFLIHSKVYDFCFSFLNLLSLTVMNVSLDTLHNSEWSEFLYMCRPLLYIPTNMHLPSCAFPYQTKSKLLQVVCTIHVILSLFGLFTVYMFYIFFSFFILYFKISFTSKFSDFEKNKNKIRVNFSICFFVFIVVLFLHISTFICKNVLVTFLNDLFFYLQQSALWPYVTFLSFLSHPPIFAFRVDKCSWCMFLEFVLLINPPSTLQPKKSATVQIIPIFKGPINEV